MVVFSAALSNQSGEVLVVVDVLTDLSPQAVESSTILKRGIRKVHVTAYVDLRNGTSKVDSRQVWRRGDCITENRSISRDEILKHENDRKVSNKIVFQNLPQHPREHQPHA